MGHRRREKAEKRKKKQWMKIRIWDEKTDGSSGEIGELRWEGGWVMEWFTLNWRREDDYHYRSYREDDYRLDNILDLPTLMTIAFHNLHICSIPHEMIYPLLQHEPTLFLRLGVQLVYCTLRIEGRICHGSMEHSVHCYPCQEWMVFHRETSCRSNKRNSSHGTHLHMLSITCHWSVDCMRYTFPTSSDNKIRTLAYRRYCRMMLRQESSSIVHIWNNPRGRFDS